MEEEEDVARASPEKAHHDLQHNKASVDKQSRTIWGAFVRNTAMERSPGTCSAMSSRSRRWKSLRALCSPGWRQSESLGQFRIPPKHELGFAPLELLRSNSHALVLKWVLWTFRATYFGSIVSFLLFYFVLIMIYTLVIQGMVIAEYLRNGDECMPGFNYDHPHRNSENFSLAFELSWTTMSTVGYGVVSIPAEQSCNLLRYALSTEAFIGVLYTGMCGAIFVSKISRGNTSAHVTFSSAVCLQYERIEVTHDGASASVDKGSIPTEDSGKGESGSEVLTTSYPFLEFRVVNYKGNYIGGEISDAEIKAGVFSVCLVGNATRASVAMALGQNLSDDDDDSNEMYHTQDHVLHPETGIPSLKRTYRTIQLEPSRHPHLSNEPWHLKHALDHNSPFLKRDVRHRLDKLRGWPAAWNSPDEIRSRLDSTIYEVGMIFTGISGQTASNVFTIHYWKAQDLYIGWKFSSMSYLAANRKCKKSHGMDRWKLDLSLAHDIIPQDHGGNEPLGGREPKNVVQLLRDQIEHISDE